MSFSSRNSSASAPRRLSSKLAAFSLVEVTVALGIVAVGFVSILALLPNGMSMFRTAVDTSVGAQIVQRVVTDAEETDFDYLVPTTTNPITGYTTAGQYYRMPIRYFDDQGNELLTTTGVLPAAQASKLLYTVLVRGSEPGAADVSSHSTDYFTSVPTSGKAFNPRDATILTIQIVKNPTNKLLAFDPTGNLLWDTTKLNFPAQTYSVVIARNGHRVPQT